MKDSEKELNYLLDKIRFEIEENGGVHLKSYIDFENSFQLDVKDFKNIISKTGEIIKREKIQKQREEQLKKLGI